MHRFGQDPAGATSTMQNENRAWFVGACVTVMVDHRMGTVTAVRTQT